MSEIDDDLRAKVMYLHRRVTDLEGEIDKSNNSINAYNKNIDTNTWLYSGSFIKRALAIWWHTVVVVMILYVIGLAIVFLSTFLIGR